MGIVRKLIVMYQNPQTGFCKCRRCKAGYYPKKYQSNEFCSNCIAPRNCMHGISNFDDCEKCAKMYGNNHMRLFPPIRDPRQRITQTRLIPPSRRVVR